MFNQKEQAIKGGRRSPAIDSFGRDQEFKSDVLRREIRLFSTELRLTSDPAKRKELEDTIAETRNEQRKLQCGWLRSKLRKRLLDDGCEKFVSGLDTLLGRFKKEPCTQRERDIENGYLKARLIIARCKAKI